MGIQPIAKTAVDTLTTLKPESPLDSRLRGNDGIFDHADEKLHESFQQTRLLHIRLVTDNSSSP